MNGLSRETLTLNMGPQHPSTHGVLRLVLELEGETVRKCLPVIGYLHTGIEKEMETRTYLQNVTLVDRIEYVASYLEEMAFYQAVERLMDVEVPPRARYIRVLMCELNRIASHLVAMGTYGLDLGTFSPFLYAFREREMILDLFEEVCGARLTYSYITIGGVHDDLPDGWIDNCTKFVDYFEPRIAEYHTLLTNNHIFIKRTANIGVLPKALALAHGCSGPMLRGSLDRTKGDPDWDLRKIEKYSGYGNYEFNAVIPPFEQAPPETVIGDCWHRYMVRMVEVVESVKIVRQGLERYKKAAGSHRVELPKHLSAGEAYVETECPRGQMGFYVVGSPAKGQVPLRVRARSSSMANLSVAGKICAGCLIADIPAIIGSIDIVMGEIDR